MVSNYSDAQKAAVSYTPGLDEIVATPSIVKFYGKKTTGFLKPVVCSVAPQHPTSNAAVAGYPNISVPVGLTPDGKPVGIWMYSTFLREPSLLGFAYDLEQELKPRRMPKFLSSVPPLPPDAGICDTLPKPNQSQAGLPHLRRHWGTNKPIPGL